MTGCGNNIVKRFAFMRDKTADVSVECNIYLLLFFSRLWKKQIVPNSFIRTERLFRGFLRVLEARWTVGGPPREIFPSFFGWAVDRYLCRGNYRGCGGGTGIRPKIKILARGPPLHRFPDDGYTKKAPLRSSERGYTCEGIENTSRVSRFPMMLFKMLKR